MCVIRSPIQHFRQGSLQYEMNNCLGVGTRDVWEVLTARRESGSS
jgi:hypothetical protein